MSSKVLSRLSFACLVLLCATSVRAQNPSWAQAMFEKLNHDFGVVARGADVTYRLKFVNKYPNVVHILGVRTSCGCISATLSKDVLASQEEGYVLLTLDTKRFTRERNATVTITFNQPQFQEVVIQVKAYIRTDVVLTPGSAEFGGVTQGTAQDRHVAVSYAGRSNWTIRRIICNNEHVNVSFNETSRGHDRVDYDVLVSLKPTAPIGEIREQLRIVTDDQNSPEIPFLVEAKVQAEISVTPEVVSFGVMAPGETKTQNIVIRGRKPFMVEKIESESGSEAFQARLPIRESAVHVLPLIVTAPSQPGAIADEFTITLSGTAQPVHFKVSGKVVPRGF